MLETVKDESATRCLQVFPFVDAFETVVRGEVSIQYLDRLVCVLEPVIDLASEAIARGECQVAVVAALVYSTAALARVRVVQAYGEELACVSEYGEDAVIAAMVHEWEQLVERDEMVFVEYSEYVEAMLGDSVRSLWQTHAIGAMLTARQVLSIYGLAVASLRVVVVGELLVECESGVLLTQLDMADMHKCVLPREHYRTVIRVVKENMLVASGGSIGLESVYDAAVANRGGFVGVLTTRVVDWLWLVVTNAGWREGYCYQLLIAPTARYVACQVLGSCPRVSHVLWYLKKACADWAGCTARCVVAGVVHVERSGDPDVVALQANADKLIGMAPSPVDDDEPDYFARALWDEFIERHRQVDVQHDVVMPVDVGFEALSLDTTLSGGIRGFIDVANELYSGVGELVSPRTESAGKLGSGLVATDEHLNERDSERVRDVYARLADGAVIEEAYFRRSRRRFMRHRHRPRLDVTEGHSYHVFEGFCADGGGGTGPWRQDDGWDIPGWRSYIATFDPGVRTLSFIAPDPCVDVRMDCTGDGALELGDCKVVTEGTVLWFSQSIKFQLIAKTLVDLRISIPDAGSALAIGVDMRRYLYIPGYVVAVRSFDVVTGNPVVSIPVLRTRGSLIAGCHFYAGRRSIPRGRHRFKITQLPSLAPVKMVLKARPVEALAYLSVCGMRLKPRSRDYVSVLFDAGNVDMYVTLSEDAEVQVSIAQVVRVAEFDITVASARKV